MKRELNLKEISRIVKLLKIINNEKYASVSEIAKEGGWKKTDVGEFILNNPKHFLVVINNKIIEKRGFCINECFEDINENFTTDEWLNNKIQKEKNIIYVKYLSGAACYAHLKPYSITQAYESQYDRYRKYKWENTSEKMFSICKLLNQSYSKCIEVTKDDLDKMEKDGWKISYI